MRRTLQGASQRVEGEERVIARPAQGPRIRPATWADIGPLASLLTSAFYDDPVHRWLFAHTANRATRLERLFTLFLREPIARGTALTTAGLEGTILWARPSLTARERIRQLKQDIQTALLLGGGLVRGIRWWLSIESRHPRFPHCYLLMLGVAPRHQGKGIGSALLRHLIEKCDAERLPVYLDTGNKTNVPFYRRRGFEVIRKVTLPGGPEVFQMIHQPGGAPL